MEQVKVTLPWEADYDLHFLPGVQQKGFSTEIVTPLFYGKLSIEVKNVSSFGEAIQFAQRPQFQGSGGPGIQSLSRRICFSFTWGNAVLEANGEWVNMKTKEDKEWADQARQTSLLLQL